MNSDLVNSHIQTPCFMLKKFENEKHELFYCDVKTGEIKLGHAKSLYQEHGYYSAETERFLSENIERPLGKIAKFIEYADFSAPIQVPPDMNITVMKYVHSLIARGPSMITQINQNSIFFPFLAQRQQHDFAARETFELAQETGLFLEYFITFMVNSTDLPFVLPTGGLYESKDIINCPITPHKAVALVKPESPVVSELLDGGTCRILLENEQERIMKMNVGAFWGEIHKDRRYIVAPNREVLEITRDVYLRETASQN